MGTSSSKEQVPQNETLRSVFLVNWGGTSLHQTILVADRNKSGNLDEVSHSTTGYYFHWGSSLRGASSVKNGEHPETKPFNAHRELDRGNKFFYQGTTSWTNSGIEQLSKFKNATGLSDTHQYPWVVAKFSFATVREYCQRKPYHLLNNNCRKAVSVTMGGILQYTDDNDVKDIVGTIVNGRPGEFQEPCLQAAELRMKYDLSEEGDDIRYRMGADARRPNLLDIPDVYRYRQGKLPYTCWAHPSGHLEGGCECHRQHDDHLKKEMVGGPKNHPRRTGKSSR